MRRFLYEWASFFSDGAHEVPLLAAFAAMVIVSINNPVRMEDDVVTWLWPSLVAFVAVYVLGCGVELATKGIRRGLLASWRRWIRGRW